MKKLVAGALLALASLGTSPAFGEPQGVKLDALIEPSAGSDYTAWLMALAFLGLVVIRRTRSSFMR